MQRRYFLAGLGAIVSLHPVELGMSTITSPVPNRVFQQVSGAGAFRIQWRGTGVDLVRLKNAAGDTISESSSGLFASIAPSWYDAVLVSGGVEGDSIKVGVGDVYLVAGQSNAVSPLQPSNYVYPRPTSPGKVIVSDYYGQGSHAFIDSYDDMTSQYKGSICWIACGKTLNRSYPVMFVNVAQGNTSTADWVNTLITRVFQSWAIYSPKAILWMQGESDAGLGFTQAQSFQNMHSCIISLRQVTITPWVMALNSSAPSYAPIRAAQQQIINYNWGSPSNLVKLGPDTDQYRNGEVEFLGDDIRLVGEAWAARIIALGL